MYISVQTINIALPKTLVKAIDAAAKREYKNRSEFIREATRVYIREQIQLDRLFAYGKKEGKKLGITSEKEVNDIIEAYRQGK